MKKLLYPIFLFLLSAATAAQEKNASPIPVFNSAQGPVILFGGSSINSAGKDNEGTHFVISRGESANGPFKQLPIPGMVRSIAEFRRLAGQGFVSSLQKQLKQGSEAALWTYLQQHPDLSAYALASFDISFRRAMGAAIIDEEVKGQKGKTYVYKIDVDGAGTRSSFSTAITIGQAPDYPVARLAQVRAKDSTVSLRWRMKLQKDIPFLADVYKQSGGTGSFIKLDTRILATHKGDSAVFLFTERVQGNSAYRYFIRPADLLQNTGAYTSDTASLVVADYHKLPFVTQLKAKDTMNGILLTWKTLAADPIISGIEIQRSRDSRGDYVVIDTVSAQSSSYMDRRLLSHVAYYYRLAVLHGGRQQQSEKYYAAVTSDQQKTSHTPDAPYGLSAATGRKGVMLHWQPVNDPDLYAYYVYRGTSLDAPMDVISPSLTDTAFVDTASNLSRQTNYIYAVKAVTNASRESPFSDKVAAHMANGKERPLTPGGISVIRKDNRLFIRWDDVKRNDPSILGYLLYKRRAGRTPLQYDIDRPASQEATRLEMTPVFNGLINAPYIADTIASDGASWEYLVSAIDGSGIESGLSPAAVYQPVNSLHAPTQLLVRNTKEGVSLQWLQSDMTGVTSFTVYRRSIAEKKAQKLATVKTNQFTDKQVTAGILYVYTVAPGENGPQSDEKTIRPAKIIQ